MALFLDANFVSSADLIRLDPEVTKVAQAEQIQIDTTDGIAAQACDEVGQKILSENQAFTGFLPPFAQPYTQTAAVINLVGPSVNRARIPLSQIVVSSPLDATLSGLKRYAVYSALVLFYRAAFYKKVNDRYDNKRKMYEEEIRKKYWPRFYNQGCPIVNRPLAAPGALHEFQAGVWDASRLSLVAGTNPATANYDVAITWVDQSKYVSPSVKGNAESGASALLSAFQITAANVLQVDITPLNPPNGQAPVNVMLGQGLIVPGNATGWNLYVGASGAGTLFLQNAAPIPVATKQYIMLGAPVLSGAILDAGQWPESYLTMQRTLFRG